LPTISVAARITAQAFPSSAILGRFLASFIHHRATALENGSIQNQDWAKDQPTLFSPHTEGNGYRGL
jgi:hypothetical protein